jgi:hypothetical protein
MKSLMRTLTLTAAALAALVAAPQSNADEFRRGEARETRQFRGETFHGRGFRGEFRGHGFRGPVFREHAFVRPAFFGHRRFTPFRVFGGFRFFSYFPGPGYVWVDDCGWVLPPFAGAVWVPRFDRFGVVIGGFWR